MNKIEEQEPTLARCPFCGRKAILKQSDNWSHTAISCPDNKCPAYVTILPPRNELQKQIKRWNIRAEKIYKDKNGRECFVIIKQSGRGGKGAPRNCLIQYIDTGKRVVRPFRGLRRVHDE